MRLNIRETGGERVPTFKIGARGIVGRSIHIACASETRAYRAAGRKALEARCRDGEMETMFPFGTYQMRVLHRAPVEAEPPAGAILAMPGATLSEVKAELARERAAATLRAEAHAMIDEVREAFTEEAKQIVEHDDFELIGAPSATLPTTTAASETDDAQADGDAPAAADDGACEGDADATTEKPVIECHRFDERPEAGTARRLSTLRDRRGRRSRRRGRHGSDPPE